MLAAGDAPAAPAGATFLLVAAGAVDGTFVALILLLSSRTGGTVLLIDFLSLPLMTVCAAMCPDHNTPKQADPAL